MSSIPPSAIFHIFLPSPAAFWSFYLTEGSHFPHTYSFCFPGHSHVNSQLLDCHHSQALSPAMKKGKKGGGLFLTFLKRELKYLYLDISIYKKIKRWYHDATNDVNTLSWKAGCGRNQTDSTTENAVEEQIWGRTIPNQFQCLWIICSENKD